MLAFVISMGTILGLLAAAMAWLITYDEYAKHFPDRRPVIRAASEVAAVSLLFFLVLSIAIGFALQRFLLAS